LSTNRDGDDVFSKASNAALAAVFNMLASKRTGLYRDHREPVPDEVEDPADADLEDV